MNKHKSVIFVLAIAIVIYLYFDDNVVERESDIQQVLSVH